MKKTKLSLLALALCMTLAGCGGQKSDDSAGSSADQSGAGSSQQAADPVTLTVFAAASMTETLNEITELYKAEAPAVSVTYNFDSSGTLKTQIEQGAPCDLFISAGQKQMNELDKSADPSVNTAGLDFVLAGTRIDLLENKVVLIVPQGSEKKILGFEDLGKPDFTAALGNADVPVGQYSEEILKHLNIWDKMNAQSRITFGTNVKEVVAQVESAAVDCGIVYKTDAAASGKVEVVAEAPAGSYKPAVYPAAVLSTSTNQDAAKAFLDFLQTDACKTIFVSAGFDVK